MAPSTPTTDTQSGKVEKPAAKDMDASELGTVKGVEEMTASLELEAAKEIAERSQKKQSKDTSGGNITQKMLNDSSHKVSGQSHVPTASKPASNTDSGVNSSGAAVTITSSTPADATRKRSAPDSEVEKPEKRLKTFARAKKANSLANLVKGIEPPRPDRPKMPERLNLAIKQNAQAKAQLSARIAQADAAIRDVEKLKAKPKKAQVSQVSPDAADIPFWGLKVVYARLVSASGPQRAMFPEAAQDFIKVLESLQDADLLPQEQLDAMANYVESMLKAHKASNHPEFKTFANCLENAVQLRTQSAYPGRQSNSFDPKQRVEVLVMSFKRLIEVNMQGDQAQLYHLLDDVLPGVEMIAGKMVVLRECLQNTVEEAFPKPHNTCSVLEDDEECQRHIKFLCEQELDNMAENLRHAFGNIQHRDTAKAELVTGSVHNCTKQLLAAAKLYCVRKLQSRVTQPNNVFDIVMR